jgi:uncharacterized protein
VQSSLIPLFPLGTVLFPGAPLSLHVFEPRYRRLVADLLTAPDDQPRFGVVAIRSGHEVGVQGIRALHDVGCVATVTEITREPDGTFDLECVGSTRFSLVALDHARPYLRSTVAWIPEPAGDVGALARIVAERYGIYQRALAGLRGVTREEVDLPSDPRLVSYLVASSVIADTVDRQRFLAEADDAGRLAAEARWLSLESRLLSELSAIPAGRLIDVASSVN